MLKIFWKKQAQTNTIRPIFAQSLENMKRYKIGITDRPFILTSFKLIQRLLFITVKNAEQILNLDFGFK